MGTALHSEPTVKRRVRCAAVVILETWKVPEALETGDRRMVKIRSNAYGFLGKPAGTQTGKSRNESRAP